MPRKSDSKFKAKCRVLQAQYRSDFLKVPSGTGPYANSNCVLENFISDGDKSGLNFFNEYTFRYAKQKVNEKQINSDLTIDEFRLFNNLLSSMPMAFNLFGTFRKILEDNPSEASQIGRIVFSTFNWLFKISFIDIEFIPRPIKFYTNDKSAFDIFIKGADKDGKSGIITIEIKYTDLLGTNSSQHKDKKLELLKDEKLVSKDQIKFYEKYGFGQLERNFLLTLAYQRIHKINYFEHIILSPREDDKSRNEIDVFREKLNNYQDHIHKFDLEDFINSAKQSRSIEYQNVACQFYQRYLNFSLLN